MTADRTLDALIPSEQTREVLHAHFCGHCGSPSPCPVMICRATPTKTCWPCRTRGFE